MPLLTCYLTVIWGVLVASIVISPQFGAHPQAHAWLIEHDFLRLIKRQGPGSGGGVGGGGPNTGFSGALTGAGTGDYEPRPSKNRSPDSNAGGTSKGGSGTPRTYGNGAYYSGGAQIPFTAGKNSTKGLSTAVLLASDQLAFFPGPWIRSVYVYPFSKAYGYFNSSANRNESKPIQCLCQRFGVCGCDDNDQKVFFDSILGTGDVNTLNATVVRIAEVNGTSQIFLNGTLTNGTTADGPNEKYGSGHEFTVGQVFGIIIGALVFLFFAFAFYVICGCGRRCCGNCLRAVRCGRRDEKYYARN